MPTMRRVVCLLLLVATSAFAEDQVYRYVGPDGAIHYTDKPPDKQAKPVQLPPLQTFKSTGTPTSGSAPASEPAKPAGTPSFSLSIDSPAAEETFREVNPDINISVSVLPGLVNGYGLIYAVDGQPQNEEPVSQTSYVVSGLERGSHTLSVSLVNARGETLDTQSVTVHMKPPVVKP